MNIIDFDGKRIVPYLNTTLKSFMSDPPDSTYQRGYLAACVDIYREGLGKDNDLIKACEKIVYGEIK